MAVVIRSDATGDTLYDGKVTSIAPSPDKNQSGDTITVGDIVYDTKVEVISESTGLHIGMSSTWITYSSSRMMSLLCLMRLFKK